MSAVEKAKDEGPSRMSMDAEALKTYKIVVIGDGTVGKTCFCYQYAKKEFNTDYVPTVFDTYPIEMTLKDGTEQKVTIWDTAGQADFDNIRALVYPQTNLFMVCFSLNNKASFGNIRDIWLKDLTGDKERSKVPRFLVGTKKDLKGKEGAAPSDKEIEKMVKEFNFLGYMEVSSMTDPSSVVKAFEEATAKSMEPEKEKKGCPMM